jgi:PQQ-dependent dehydrogenase (methanol/ethanol family)
MQRTSSGCRARLRAFLLGIGAAALFGLNASSQERLPNNAPPPPDTLTARPVTANVDVTDAQMLAADKDKNNWLLHGRTYDGQSYSPLTQINAANVTKLKPVSLIQTGIANTFEGTPIEVNGVLYIITAFDHVQAYGAVTGETLWAYNPTLQPTNYICCGPDAKGVAVAYGKVFVPLLDGRVVALNARTGAVVWTAKQEDILPKPTQYYTFTSAPQVFDGMVLLGNAGSEYPSRGFVEALSADTGKLLWRFNTTAAPDEPGGGPSAWGGDSWTRGGGAVWNTPAIDAKNGLAIFAVANPNPDYQGEERPGNNLYTNSIVAVDVHTGKIKWWYQEVPHDLWDYDAVAPVALFDIVVNGKVIPAVAEGGKVGFVFILNRLTGELIHKTPFVEHSDNMFAVPGTTPITRYPGINGGSLWSTPAFSPLTHDFYIMGVNEAYSIVTRPLQPLVEGQLVQGQRTGGGQRAEPAAYPPASGNLTAINVNTGNVSWQVKTKYPMYGGVVATAGNLVITGEMTGHVDAFDARTGKELWRYFLGAGVCTPPITYQVKGMQYLAVSAGGCRTGRVYATQMARQQYGDVIAIFALPGK